MSRPRHALRKVFVVTPAGGVRQAALINAHGVHGRYSVHLQGAKRLTAIPADRVYNDRDSALASLGEVRS